MSKKKLDYFATTSPVEAILRRVKGNYRRRFLLNAIAEDGIESIPEAWMGHDLSPTLKTLLVQQHPQSCGGEDLPDLEPGEVEIARVSLVDSVHGEVISLRARPGDEEHSVRLRIVDEYCVHHGYEYELQQDVFPGPLSAEEVLHVFRNSNPCACESACRQRFDSDFYPELDDLAEDMEIKVTYEM